MEAHRVQLGTFVRPLCACHGTLVGTVSAIYKIEERAQIVLGDGERIVLPFATFEVASPSAAK